MRSRARRRTQGGAVAASRPRYPTALGTPAGRRRNLRTVNIFVLGAGQVGATVVQALHEEHHLTVLDQDESRLLALATRYDVATVEGNGASRSVLSAAGVTDADLVIACTSRDETNIVAAMITKAISARTTTVVRTSNPEYLQVWREGQLDVDFIVSSETETAYAISRTIG